MKARDVMNSRVTAATPRAVGRDLALQLLSGMYSGLPVIDAKGKVLGVVTEFDLLNAIRNGRDLQTIKAEDIMTQPAICVREDEELDAVITKMKKKYYSCSCGRRRWQARRRDRTSGCSQPHD
jgi:CBS domain-containing protein